MDSPATRVICGPCHVPGTQITQRHSVPAAWGGPAVRISLTQHDVWLTAMTTAFSGGIQGVGRGQRGFCSPPALLSNTVT